MVERQWQIKRNPPLPVVNPPDVWQAYQDARVGRKNPTVARDTGGSSSDGGNRYTPPPLGSPQNPYHTTQAGSSWVDAPATRQPETRVTQAGYNYGTTYKDPGGGWNPWTLYDGGEVKPNVDGWYDKSKDVDRWDVNGTPENDRNRVWRWTLDAARAQGWDAGAPANAAKLKELFLANVARLKRDYQANGYDWASSAFAGYDRMPGTQGGAAGKAAAASATQAATNAAAAQAGKAAAASSAAAQQAGGKTVADQNGGGGGQNPQAGQPGYAGFFNLNNPQQAVRDYMNQHGISPDSNMFFGDWIRKLFGNLVPAVMQLTTDSGGKPALDRLSDLGSLLDPIFYGGQGTLGANLGGFADTAQKNLIGAMPGMAADTQADLLRNLTALRTVSTNPYLGSAINNRLDASIGAAQDYASKIIKSGGKMPQEWSLWDFINNQLPAGYVNPFAGR